MIVRLLVLVFGLVASAQALTNESATVLWTPTTDAAIKYELRWKNFKTLGQWQTIAPALDSTLGRYDHVYAFADSTGDRTACWDMRAVYNGVASPWLSDVGQEFCQPIPLAVVVVPPPPAGLTVVTATPMTVVVVAKKTDCPKLATSTSGSTSLVLKRTVTCVK